jgi:hypothetical protein
MTHPGPCCGLRGDEPKFRVGNATTPDGVAESFTTSDPRIYGFRLWDYKVNDYTLRPRHKEALQALVARIAAEERSGRFSASGGWQITLDGFASKTGSFDHNKSLSAWRMMVAARCLECLAAKAGLPPRRVVIDDRSEGHGYLDAIPNLEDPRRRMVNATVHPPEIKPPPVRPPSDQFKICFLSITPKIIPIPIPIKVIDEFQKILAIATTNAKFKIEDVKTGESQVYEYNGKGIALQVPIDKVIPKKVRDRIPKPLMDMIANMLKRVVPGGGTPGTGCAPFRVVVRPSSDPKRFPSPTVTVRSFSGKSNLIVPAPGLGLTQIAFNNSIFFLKRTLIVPDPLEVNTHAALTTRVVVATEGLTRMIAAGAREIQGPYQEAELVGGY